jgi:hypothetical protein
MSTINLMDYIYSIYFNNYFNIFDIAKLDIVFTNKKLRANWLHLLEKMIINIKYYDDIDSIQCIYKRMQFFNYIVRRKIKLNCDYIFRVSNGVSYHMTEINMIDTQTTEDMLFSMLIKSTNLISIEISINIDWVKIIEYIPMIKKNNPKLEYIYIGITNEYDDQY